MIRRVLSLGAAALLLAACGDDGGRFDAQVDDIRTAVAAGDRQAALAALDQLSAAAMEAHAEGAVDETEIEQLGGLLQDARHMIDEQLPAPTTTPPTTEPPPPPPTPDDDDDDDDDDKDDDDKDDEDGRPGGGRGGGPGRSDD